jgi:hypothetical protein
MKLTTTPEVAILKIKAAYERGKREGNSGRIMYQKGREDMLGECVEHFQKIVEGGKHHTDVLNMSRRSAFEQAVRDLYDLKSLNKPDQF